MNCAVNRRQVVIALSGGELVYFEMDPVSLFFLRFLQMTVSYHNSPTFKKVWKTVFLNTLVLSNNRAACNKHVGWKISLTLSGIDFKNEKVCKMVYDFSNDKTG